MLERLFAVFQPSINIPWNPDELQPWWKDLWCQTFTGVWCWSKYPVFDQIFDQIFDTFRSTIIWFTVGFTLGQVVYWNLFDLTLYKGLWVVLHLLNGHLSKDLAPKMGYQYQAYFCFQSKFSLNMASLVFGLFSVPK